MEKPRANSDKDIGRADDPRSQAQDSFKTRQADSSEPRKSTGIPKGVYRFKTHEEADEWMTRMLARSKDLEP